MIIGGVDPGRQGAIVRINTKVGHIAYMRLKYDKDGFLEYERLVHFASAQDNAIWFFEGNKGRGGWGATQNYNMGWNAGQLIGALVATNCAVGLITPQNWQAILRANSPAMAGLRKKEATKAAYLELFPHHPMGRDPQDGVLDAFMIAAAGVIVQGGQIGAWRQ